MKLTLFPFAGVFISALIIGTAFASESIVGTDVKIVDGDTVQIGETRIRLVGIDAPESDQVCLDPAGKTWGCGVDAREALTNKTTGLSWSCKVTGRDRYERTLAACDVAGEDIQKWMVRSGWALSFVRYARTYDPDEAIARSSKSGLWEGAFVAPWDWRTRNQRTVTHIADNAKARWPALQQKLDDVQAEFKDRVELRRFSYSAQHSFVIADDDLVAGPIFSEDNSKHGPAVHVTMSTRFGRKYDEYFLNVWNACVQQLDIRIEVSPRVHLGLISMHAGGPRKNGGVGFAVDGPTAVVELSASDSFTVTDLRSVPLTQIEVSELKGTIERAAASDRLALAASIKLSGAMQTHVGMGSGTAIRLAITEGLRLLNNSIIDENALILRSGRGGTSGIGVSTYFSGQLILDLGTRNDGMLSIPSSQASVGRVPSTLNYPADSGKRATPPATEREQKFRWI